MNILLISAATLAATAAAPALANDAAANAVYERMQALGSEADSKALLEKVYGQDATYLPGHKDMGIDRRDTIIKMMAGSHQRLQNAGGHIDVKFRIVERKRFGDLYVDNGYMRTSVKPKTDAPEQVSYGKFVTVIAKQPEGHWAFVTDADSDTPAANFDDAKPVEGLKFDR
jgi:ketosteroid isomerase-like protein